MIKIIVQSALLIVQVLSANSWNSLQSNGRIGSDLVVVDTDAGADDAMAISLLLSGTRGSTVIIAGITCVRGNTGVHNVTKNVLQTLDVNGRLEIPVFEGSDHGLIATPPLTHYFGEDGMGDFNKPLPNVTISQTPAAVFLANLVRKNPGEVTVLAIGPLTNLAIAGLIYPDFYKDSKEIIFLGGSTTGIGNMDGVEFNVWADPAAAEVVFASSSPSHPITIVPIETFRLLEYPWAWRQDILGGKGTAVMDFLNLAEREEPRSKTGWEASDQAVAAVFVDSSLVTSSFFGRSYMLPSGKMIVTRDRHGRNLRVISGINKDRFTLMLQSLL